MKNRVGPPHRVTVSRGGVLRIVRVDPEPPAVGLEQVQLEHTNPRPVVRVSLDAVGDGDYVNAWSRTISFNHFTT